MAETALEPRRKTTYTEDEIERGLTTLALAGGNYRKAHILLDGAIPAETLRSWKTKTHPERYEETRRRVLPRIQEKIAEEAEDLAVHYAEVERGTLAAFMAKVDELQVKDAAGAIRNLATAKAINIDKAQLLRGNPTSIVERRDIEDLFGQLSRFGPSDVVDAEVVGDSPSPSRAVPATPAD